MRMRAPLKIYLIAGLIATFNAAAYAALGESAQAVASEAKGLRAVNMVSQSVPYTANAAAYTRHQISFADGGMVTEFSNASGTVFAIAWQSSSGMPPVATFLGSYNSAYGRAQAQARIGMARSLHHLNATEGDWNVVSHANNNVFSGFSYLRSQLPVGFNLQLLAP